ncbi:VOC family protein [Streptomyces sp. SM14]|uniref:VOC family protein n=1 Tax=Streptomyces sp. SM14 TaxID=1736045 RepID=UPI000CD594B5|nr:VOC family protein [Streptomyces sp. SM14]
MITTTTPGAPCWVDIGSRDIEATSDFYHQVLGWEYVSAGPDAGGYGMYQLGGESVGGVGPLTEEGASSAWMTYFTTDDAAAVTETCRQAGGEVRVEPMDMMGTAVMAQLTDPTGGQFAVWQETGSREGEGGLRTDAPGSLCWVELYTADAPAARTFYQQAFDWQVTDMPIPGEAPGLYHVITAAGGNPEKDGHGGIMGMPAENLKDGHAYWSPVFETTDCDAAAERVAAAGGTVQMGPVDMQDVGRVATCLDRFGASFSLLTSAG